MCDIPSVVALETSNKPHEHRPRSYQQTTPYLFAALSNAQHHAQRKTYMSNAAMRMGPFHLSLKPVPTTDVQTTSGSFGFKKCPPLLDGPQQHAVKHNDGQASAAMEWCALTLGSSFRGSIPEPDLPP